MKSRLLRLPSGYAIIVEVARTRQEISQGLAGRPRLLPCYGMLFVHPRSGVYRYWMRGVLIPLDIVWLNDELTVVEIYRGACPHDETPLGTNVESRFGLELAGGMADRYSLKVGDRLKSF